MKKILSIILLFTAFASIAFTQSAIDVNDANYRFKFKLPDGWQQRKVEETDKKDAISYAFDKDDGKVAVMLLAFKVNEVKNLEDFIYTLEKDLTLNIPKRDGEYTDFDMGGYDGRSARYADTEFTELIYYYRTKNSEGDNYSYVLRFIAPSSSYHSELESQLKSVAAEFKPDF